MRAHTGCYSCLINQAERLMDTASLSPEQSREMIREVMKVLSTADMDVPVPYLGRINQETMNRLLENPDPYREIKQQENQAALDILPRLRDEVTTCSDPLERALMYSAMGNLIDHGTPGGRKDSGALAPGSNDIIDTGTYNQFTSALASSPNLFIIGDNAGEIVLDVLLLEQVQKQFDIQLTYSVRGKPVINDATREDAAVAGIDTLARVIDTGDNTPGIDLSRSSKEFIAALGEADVILAKGQGNFETLFDEDISGFVKPDAVIFFLFKVKCQRVANFTGITMGRTAFIKRV